MEALSDSQPARPCSGVKHDRPSENFHPSRITPPGPGRIRARPPGAPVSNRLLTERRPSWAPGRLKTVSPPSVEGIARMHLPRPRATRGASQFFAAGNTRAPRAAVDVLVHRLRAPARPKQRAGARVLPAARRRRGARGARALPGTREAKTEIRPATSDGLFSRRFAAPLQA